MVAVFYLSAVCQEKPNHYSWSPRKEKIKFGSEAVWKNKMLTGKNYALLTNAPSQVHFNLLDSLIHKKKINKIFSPEHGLATDQADGVVISSTENYKEIPVVSLYGKHLSPDKHDFENIDTVLIDLQDVGLRFYTYLTTIAKMLESAGENHVPVVLLDRPNPLNGEIVEGPVIDDSLKSFVGYLPIPIRYGLTIGELFQMAVQEKWLQNSNNIQLQVVRLENWRRTDYWKNLNLTWIPTSPNLPTVESVALYSGTCLFEGTNISEGRGTPTPFSWIGADFFSQQTIKTQFGISTFPEKQNPVSIKGKAVNPKFENKNINGYYLEISDWNHFSALDWTISLLDTYKNQIQFRRHFYLLWGKSELTYNKKETLDFTEKRKKYFLY